MVLIRPTLLPAVFLLRKKVVLIDQKVSLGAFRNSYEHLSELPCSKLVHFDHEMPQISGLRAPLNELFDWQAWPCKKRVVHPAYVTELQTLSRGGGCEERSKR